MDDGTLQAPRPAEAVAAGEASAAVPALVLYDGDEIGEFHSLAKDETVVGRTAGCDVVIPEGLVSRRHLVIRRLPPGENRFEVEDLDSTNGTFLNGVRVMRAPLREGDKIGVGERTLKFALLDQADLAYQSRLTGIIHLDELTGLLTRRSILRALEREMIRSLRYRRPVSALLMDLDHFKQVNDTFGHPAGSHGLAEVGRLIRESTRATDVSGRYGGEEFLTFLPETDTESAFIVAERIRESIARRTYRYGDLRFQLRVSIGIATAPEQATDARALVEAADMALYLAKGRGRNCTVTYEPSERAGIRP